MQDAGRRTQLLSASVGICIITIITLMCTASLCGGCSTCVCLFAPATSGHHDDDDDDADDGDVALVHTRTYILVDLPTWPGSLPG